MIFVNALANILPLNGMTTGEVSAHYPNLFTPTAITFSIWGLIYLLLACFVLYQFGVFGGKDAVRRATLIKTIGFYFAVSSLANAAWIFFWHYQMIGLTTVCMLVILICLIVIASKLSKVGLTKPEKILVKFPFSVYFGWIVIATIANITVFLVSLNWNGFGISEQLWMVIVIFVGLFLSIATMRQYKDAAFGLVVIWAYIGILIKHISPVGFDGEYPFVILAAALSILLLALSIFYLVVKRKKLKMRQ